MLNHFHRRKQAALFAILSQAGLLPSVEIEPPAEPEQKLPENVESALDDRSRIAESSNSTHFLQVSLQNVSFVRPFNYFLTLQLSIADQDTPQLRTEVYANTNHPKFQNNVFELPIPPNCGVS